MGANCFLGLDDPSFVFIGVHSWLNFSSNSLNIEVENAVGLSLRANFHGRKTPLR
jgi:hypothetical protein